MAKPNFLVLTGDAKGCFDVYFNLLKIEIFKFLMIRETNASASWQMLLMIEGKPHKTHAQALQEYMQGKGLLDIVVHGGGFVLFSKNMKTVKVEGSSAEYDASDPVHIHDHLRLFREDMFVDAKSMDLVLDRRNHCIYTLEQVKKAARK